MSLKIPRCRIFLQRIHSSFYRARIFTIRAFHELLEFFELRAGPKLGEPSFRTELSSARYNSRRTPSHLESIFFVLSVHKEGDQKNFVIFMCVFRDSGVILWKKICNPHWYRDDNSRRTPKHLGQFFFVLSIHKEGAEKKFAIFRCVFSQLNVYLS